MRGICPCRRIHVPAITRAETDLHHVPPTSWPLADPADRRRVVRLCANAHRLCHSLLNAYVANRGVPPRAVLRRFPPLVRSLAEESWARTNRAAKLPITQA